MRPAAICQFCHTSCQPFGSFAAFFPMLAQDRLAALLGHVILDRLNFGIGIGDKMVDRHDDRNAKGFHIGNVTAKVRTPLNHGINIFFAQIGLGDTAVHLHRADRCHDHHRIRRNPGLAAFDVHELFSAQISAKARFCHHIIRQLQRRGGGNNRVTAMCNIGERATMHKGRVVFQRLHQIGLHRIL